MVDRPRNPPGLDEGAADEGAADEGPAVPVPVPEPIVPPAPESGVAAAAYAPSPEEMGRVVRFLNRFLRSHDPDEGIAFMRKVIIARLRKLLKRRGRTDVKIEVELVDEIAQRAFTEAIEMRWPPWTPFGIEGWVTRICHRSIAAHYKGQKRHNERTDDSVDVDELPGDRAFPETDYGARAHLLVKFMEHQLDGDPAKEKTFRLMWAHHNDGFTLEELAAREGTTPNALSARFYRFRVEARAQDRVDGQGEAATRSHHRAHHPPRRARRLPLLVDAGSRTPLPRRSPGSARWSPPSPSSRYRCSTRRSRPARWPCPPRSPLPRMASRTSPTSASPTSPWCQAPGP